MRQFSSIVMRNSVFGLGAQLVIKLLSFCFTVFIVRNLGADVYGQYAAIMAFGSVFLFIGDLGLSPYMVREVARLRGAPDGQAQINVLYGNVLALRLLLSLLSVLLMLLVAVLSARPWVMIGALALNASGMVLYGFQGTSDALLAGYERLDLSSFAKVAYQFVFVILGSAALALGLGYYGLIFATLTGVVLLTYYCWRGVQFLGAHPVYAKGRSWQTLLRASTPFGIISFTLGLSYKFDSVLLNIARGNSETAYYNAAYSLVFSAVILSNVLNTALYPSLARQITNTAQDLAQLYSRMLRYLLLLALPIAIGGALLADQIVVFLYGASFAPAALALRIVIWVVPLMFASEFLGYVVVISNQERKVARAVVISTGINVALNLLLVPRFGFVAAAAMTVFTEVVLVSQYIWQLRATLARIPWASVLVRPLLAAVAMGALTFALHELPLLLNVAISGLMYGGMLLLLGTIGKDEMRFVRSLRPAPADGSAS